MATSMKKVMAFMDYFQKKQREFNYRETGNLLLLQWDMRVIMDHIGDDEELRLLVRFFMQLADDRSMKEFKENYAQYYEAMITKRNDLIHIEQLKKDTAQRGREKNEL